MKKIIGLITAFLMICSVLCCCSIVGENVHKSVFEDGYSVSVSCDDNDMTIYPFETAVYGVEVTNTGDIIDTYVLDCPDLIDCCYWSELNIYEITLNPGDSGIVVLTVEPYYIEEATYTITVRATSSGDPLVNDSVPTFTTVILDDRVIDVSTNKPIYDLGEPVVLSLTNIAEEAIEGNPTLEVFNSDHELVYGCYPDCWITLEHGESFTDIWYPNVPQDKYTVEGVFLTYEDQYFDDESFFILDENPLVVTTDKIIYESGEMVNLLMTNVGDSLIAGNPSFLIYNSDDELVHEVYIYLWIELEPGETFDEITWDQKDMNSQQQVPNGSYKLIGQLWASEEEFYIDDYKFYIGYNLPPDKPIITGPTRGRVGEEYTYCIPTAVDPEGDGIYAIWDWGDGTGTGWEGPYESGEEICASHTWNQMGDFIISARLQDDYGSMSPTGTLKVTMPRSRTFDLPFFKFLQNYPMLFQLLQRLLNL